DKTEPHLPMKLVPDPQSPARRRGMAARPPPRAADEGMPLRADAARRRPLAQAHPHGGPPRPRPPVAQTVHLVDDHIRALLGAAVTRFAGRVLRDDTSRPLPLQCPFGRP